MQHAPSTPSSPGGSDDGAGPRGLPDVDVGGAGADAPNKPVEGHAENVRDGRGPGQRERLSVALNQRDKHSSNPNAGSELALIEASGLPGSSDSGPKAGDVAVHVVDVRQACIFEQAGNVNSILGIAVGNSRKAQRLRQDAVAAAMGVTRARISQLENGDAWSLDTAARMAVVLGVPLPELLGGHVLDADEAAVVAAMRRGDWLQAIEMIAARAKTGR